MGGDLLDARSDILGPRRGPSALSAKPTDARPTEADLPERPRQRIALQGRLEHGRQGASSSVRRHVSVWMSRTRKFPEAPDSSTSSHVMTVG